ncbi:MAG TPA: beta-ketoacyl synthase N-terminal-like domain-containing protein [Streptosporangiaceae bacterium]|nr:beta-ketoacyl synthase N-terminal-like domain-containing protein [Streptosporangiaceae bacterium]
MTALIAGSAVRTCFGDGAATFAALTEGRSGVAPLKHHDPAHVGVAHGYEINTERPAQFEASEWLTVCVREALDQAGVDPARQRCVALVGTGLRELSAVERMAAGGAPFGAGRLHFRAAVERAAPGIAAVWTLAGACSAGGHALAMAQDLIELGEAEAVVVGAADAMTASMLAMIGRAGDEPATEVRPFDVDRVGALLGDGAVALVLVPDEPGRPCLARLLSCGLSCDAWHQTAPDPAGTRRAMTDALERAGRVPADVDLVLAHGTGTLLNDVTEAQVLTEVFTGCQPGPLVTAIKGAVGHTSGGAALLNVAMAVQCLATGTVPPVAGLRDLLPEAAGLRLVRDAAVASAPRTVQTDAFGFGGVNAVSVIEAVP